MTENSRTEFRGTTVLAVIKDNNVAMAADGQVTLGNTVMKGNARKVRKINDGNVIVGFAGATADAFTLFERFEVKVKEYNGDITRSAVELAKEWRTDKALRRLEAMLLVADRGKYFLFPVQEMLLNRKKGSSVSEAGEVLHILLLLLILILQI